MATKREGYKRVIEGRMNTNIFNFTYDYIPPIGDDIEKIGGESIEETLQRYHKYLCGEYKKHLTIRNKYRIAKKLFEYINGVIDKETITRWSTHLNKNYSHNTINTYRDQTNHFLEFLGYNHLKLKTLGTIDTDKETLAEYEINQLFNTSTNPETRLILNLLWDGLRPRTIINIKISNIDSDKLYLKDTKTGNNHAILSPQTQKTISNYLKIRPTPLDKEDKDYLLICNKSNWRRKPYRTTLPIDKQLKKLAKDSELNKNIYPYMIRRTSATLRLDKYSKYYAGDIKIVQRLFRHKKPETTLKYDHKTDDDLRKYLSNIDEEIPNREKNITPEESSNSLNTLLLYSPQLNNLETEDNSTFSFSISFFPTPFVTGDMGLVFCIPHEILEAAFYGLLFHQSHITSLEVMG